MVLPAAIACDGIASANDASARLDTISLDTIRLDAISLDAIKGRFQRERWNIDLSPDVKPVKARSIVKHAGRYLGALTRCKSLSFETCTKRVARQSGFGA
jgi:hypothetical protein